MSLEESDIGSDHLSNLDTSLDEDQILESLSRLRLEIFRFPEIDASFSGFADDRFPERVLGSFFHGSGEF